MSLDQNLLFSFALAQSGEFAFVLFSVATRQAVLEQALTSRLIVVVALSMALTPLLMLVNEKLVQPRIGTRERPERKPDEIDQECPVIIAGFGRFGHVIGRLLVANGVGTTVLDNDSDQVDLLRSLGVKVYYGDASRLDLLKAAGAGTARLIIVATDEREKTLEIVATVKKHFPKLTILARARGRPHAYDLIEAGVDHVYRETLDSSLTLGVDALRLLGFRGVQAHAAARTFRRHDEDSVRELASMRHDRQAYLSRARERIAHLEELLRADLEEAQTEHPDAAWDTDSLREEFGKTETKD
jgi:voltage-gated potassium channel Kch